MPTFLNRALDRVSRTHLILFGGRVPAYQVCGYTGFLAGAVQSLILVKALGLSYLVLLGMTGMVILTFYGLVMVTKVLTGEEQIIYYHHEIAVMAMIALSLRLTHHPLLPYLDIGILGIGLFLAFGRVGCLMVGCCHGRPYKFGLCYRREHAKEGFPDSLVGVRLFPIQAVESLFVLGVVLLGDFLVARGQHAGEALELYTVVYGCGRFAFEFLRGDVDRPYFLGFSQAQWISLALFSALLWAELRGTLPFHLWHVAAGVGLMLIVLIIAVGRQLESAPRHLLTHPAHIQEIAAALNYIFVAAHTSPAARHVCSTTLGIRISAGAIEKPGWRIFHYALSAYKVPLSPASARVLAPLILLLRHPFASFYRLTRGSSGVFHVFVSEPMKPSGPV